MVPDVVCWRSATVRSLYQQYVQNVTTIINSTGSKSIDPGRGCQRRNLPGAEPLVISRSLNERGTPQVSPLVASLGGPNALVDAAATRYDAAFAEPIKLRNTLSRLASTICYVAPFVIAL